MNTLRGNRWASLAILSIGFLMILLDTTIVNVSIPTIIRDLSASLSDLEWVISGYALSFAALLITFGRLGDLYGRRNLFVGGLAVFTIASFFSGEATSSSTLIIARLFQGVGGAMISPATLSIISSTFKGRERATAFGIWGATAGIAVALGPILGGYFTTYQTWRWIFRVNIPIGILAIIATYLIVEESKEPKDHRIDVPGMVTSTLGFFFLVFALIEGQTYGWWSQAKAFSAGGFGWDHSGLSIIGLSFILSAVFLAIFGIIEYIKTKAKLGPAINIDFFKLASFRYGLVAIAVISLGEFSSLFTLPIFLQSIKGMTPLHSGIATLPLAVAVMIAAPLSAKLVNRIGSKWVITTGISAEFLGIFLLSRLNLDTEYTSLLLPLAILGAGIGLAISQNTQVILSEINPQEAGSASGILNTVRQVGSALGIAVIGAVLAHQFNANLPGRVNAVPNLPEAAKQSIVSQVAARGTGDTGQAQEATAIFPAPSEEVANNSVALAEYQRQARKVSDDLTTAFHGALADAIASAMRVGSLFVLLGALCSLLIPNVKQRREEEAQASAH
ncbi:MAG: MFS transporter [bacterium]